MPERSRLLLLADALVEAINTEVENPSGMFAGHEFAAARALSTAANLEDLTSLEVLVIPVKETESDETRGAVRLTAQVSIGIRRHLEQGESADSLTALSDLMVNFLRRKSLVAGGITYRNAAREILVPYIPENYEEMRLFVCPIQMTYVALRAV